MRRSAFERRLRDELHAARPPRAADAERRAWHVVKAAHGERVPVRRVHRGRRLAAVVVAAALLAALALTPAGAKMGDWIGDVVDPAPKPARSALGTLPAKGRLLVVADSGAWVVRDDGRQRQLPGYRDATWSPGGLYIAAARRNALVALEPEGELRWTLPAAGPVADPRWSPDGFRIAYRSGRDLWITIGDNTGRWRLGRGVQPVPPAWRPGQDDQQQVLAYARGARIHVVRVDPPEPPRRVLFRTPPGPVPRELWWTPDGRRLIAVSETDPGHRAGSVRIYGPNGHLIRVQPLPENLYPTGSALSPDGRRLALIAEAPGARSSALLMLRTDGRGAPRRRLSGVGPLEGLTWSVDGRILVAGLPTADRWLFLRVGDRGWPDSVKHIRAQFGGGLPARTGAFPRPAGWCPPEPANVGPNNQPACSTGSAP